MHAWKLNEYILKAIYNHKSFIYDVNKKWLYLRKSFIYENQVLIFRLANCFIKYELLMVINVKFKKKFIKFFFSFLENREKKCNQENYIIDEF